MSMNLANPEPTGTDAQIGERIHQLMWRNQVTQAAFGEVLGLGQSGLSLKLRGKRSWSADELVKVAREFGVSVGYLFGEESTGPKPLPKDYEAPHSSVVIDLASWRAAS